MASPGALIGAEGARQAVDTFCLCLCGSSMGMGACPSSVSLRNVLSVLALIKATHKKSWGNKGSQVPALALRSSPHIIPNLLLLVVVISI